MTQVEGGGSQVVPQHHHPVTQGEGWGEDHRQFFVSLTKLLYLRMSFIANPSIESTHQILCCLILKGQVYQNLNLVSILSFSKKGFMENISFIEIKDKLHQNIEEGNCII